MRWRLGIMDRLEAALEVLVTRLREQNVAVVRGALSEETGLPKVCLDSEHEATLSCDAFFETAIAMAVKYVVVDVRRLQDDELDEAVAAAEEVEDAEPAVRDEVLSELKRCRDRIGYVCSFELAFIASDPPVVFSLECFAPWSEHVYGTGELLQSDDEGTHKAEELSEEEITTLAKKLAADQRFQKATRMDGRLFVARKVFGDMAEEYGAQLEDIISEATNIFELEIRAAQEDELRAKARTMLQQGRSRSSVATELGLTTHRLGKLVEGSA
jgi:hypothetical protein